MGNKNSENLNYRVVTNYEFLLSLGPAKLAQYFRTTFAHNQGCPPVPLMQVFTMCQSHASCDECWWGWLCAEHHRDKNPTEKWKPTERCWDCRWGARQDLPHPTIVCMNKKFYGVLMDSEDYCSFFGKRYKEEPKRSDVEIALRLGELKEENQKEVGDEIRRRYELKMIAKEQERRRKERELIGGDNETACDSKEDSNLEPDSGERPD